MNKISTIYVCPVHGEVAPIEHLNDTAKSKVCPLCGTLLTEIITYGYSGCDGTNTNNLGALNDRT